ncbi:MAG TPA: hypothetical protein ENK18_08845 [Deltaproteobacteria bacterium]|nr:hypothetical protein [Deltaproteobacteria bacterium]
MRCIPTTLTLSLSLGSLACGLNAARAAEPVFVSTFTHADPGDTDVTAKVQALVEERLLADGHIVLDAEVVAGVVGAEAIADCPAKPDCPLSILPKIPARIAVVARMDRLGEALVGHMELYEASYPEAFKALDVPIAGDNEHLFAAEVSRIIQTLVASVGPGPEGDRAAAASLISGEPAPAPVSSSTPAAVPKPAGAQAAQPPGITPEPGVPTTVPRGTSSAPKRGDGTTPHTAPIEEIIEGTGVARRHLVGSEQHFLRSGLDPRDYLYRAMPHAGRLVLELRGGLGVGDIDRIANLRVETRDGVQTNGWYREGPSVAQNQRYSGFLGYAPATMLDLGALFGLQYGQRFLTTGIYAVDQNGEIQDSAIEQPADIQALNLYLQPRVRAYLVPVGPAKPFLLTGAELRMFGPYQVQQPDTLSYPVPGGAIVPGWVGGGGMMIDPGPIVGFFAEGTYTRHFGRRATHLEYQQVGQWPWPEGAFAETARSTVAINGGIQFRL